MYLHGGLFHTLYSIPVSIIHLLNNTLWLLDTNTEWDGGISIMNYEYSVASRNLRLTNVGRFVV